MRIILVFVLVLLVATGVHADSFAVDENFQAEVSPLVNKLRGSGCTPGVMSCDTNNPGAVTCASGRGTVCTNVVHKYGGFKCARGNRTSKSNDTACYAAVENGIATMADLVLQKIRKGCNSIYGILEACEYSATNAGNNSFLYAETITKWTGIHYNAKLDPNNAIQIAKIITVMAWYESGQKGLGFDTIQLQKGLAAAYGQIVLPKGTPNFEQGMGNFFYTGPRPPILGNSAISPFSGQALSIRPGQPAYSSQSASVSPGASPSSSIGINQSTEVGDPSGGAGIPGPAAGTLIVQPKKVMRGKPVLISWSSVFMNAMSICRVSIAGEEFATGNQGSKQYTSTSPGEKTATLSCTKASGGTLEKTDTFIVE